MIIDPDSPMHKVWKPELYKIQLEAPTPKAVFVTKNIRSYRPPYFGYEFHGIMSHVVASELLDNTPDGTFLVREGAGANNNYYTLSIRFNNKVHHYKLFHNNGKHFVKANGKTYDSIHELVADGLITMYMEMRAGDFITLMHAHSSYQESPYMTLNRRKLKALRVNQQPLTQINNDITDGFNCLQIQQTEPVTPTTDPFVRYSKPHTFKVHTFKGFYWCELCANFLWGFTAQGVKCEDCGFVAHFKCSENLPSDCRPDLKLLRGVFGTDLTTLLTAREEILPFIVTRCVNEIELRGLNQEGIYRVSGFADEIDALKLALDRDGENTDMSECSINVVAGTLKLFLRLLPVPLITFDSHPALVAATQLKSVDNQTSSIKIALSLLPAAHYNTLKYMMGHLYRVSQRSTINKMTAHNLSTVFAPTLIAIPAQCTNLTQEIFMLELLITHSKQIFT